MQMQYLAKSACVRDGNDAHSATGIMIQVVGVDVTRAAICTTQEFLVL